MKEAQEEAEFMANKFREMNYEVLLHMNPTRPEMNSLFKEIHQTIKECIKSN